MKRKLLLGRKISSSQSYSAVKFSLSSVFYTIALRNHYISAAKLTVNKAFGVFVIIKDRLQIHLEMAEQLFSC